MPTLLALETSCDESAAAVVRDQAVLASAVASQVEEHARWGGVVPEIASRRHVEALPGLIQAVMAESGVRYAELDAIAATVAPGLVGALLVGSITGRTLAKPQSLQRVAHSAAVSGSMKSSAAASTSVGTGQSRLPDALGNCCGCACV